jgi:hypothetical protein
VELGLSDVVECGVTDPERFPGRGSTSTVVRLFRLLALVGALTGMAGNYALWRGKAQCINVF